MTLNEQNHAIDDLSRELAQVEEKIVALTYRARQEGEMFSLIGATLQGRNPESVVTENQSPDVTIVPVGRVVSISSKLIPATEGITAELRLAIKKRDDLKARLEPCSQL
jgi:hypothetical protein